MRPSALTRAFRRVRPGPCFYLLLLIVAILYEWPAAQVRRQTGWVKELPAPQNQWLRRAMIAEDYTQIRVALLSGASGGYYNDRTFDTPLSDAIEHGDLWMMHWILLRGGDPNEGVWPPLFAAANKGDPRMIRLLLEYGADADFWYPAEGCSPLMLAASCPDRKAATAMCRLLLKHGAGRAPPASYAGKTAADRAAAQGYTALAEELRPLPGRR